MVTQRELAQYDDIRGAALELYDDDRLYHVKSILSWLRYVQHTKIVSARSPQDGKILDVGCGGGEATALIKRMRPDCSVFGIDVESRNTWPLVNGLGVSLRLGNGEDLKAFANEEFDVVVSFGVLEHVDNERRFLSEGFRVLKNGGYYLLFYLPSRLGVSELMADLLVDAHSHDRKYSPKTIRDLLSEFTASPVAVTREHVLPAQLHRMSEKVGNAMNRHALLLHRVDTLLGRSPLGLFAQSISVSCRKA